MLGTLMVVGLAAPAFAQQSPSKSSEEEIVVTGIANGARVVEVDFDKVWKNCAECKRALLKLDKLARNFRDEREVAGTFATGASNCGNATPSTITTFQRSSAENVGQSARSANSIAGGLCAARARDQAARTHEAMTVKYVVPEQAKLLTHMRSFLDQLAPHLREATEAERIVHGASAGLTDTKRTRLNAKNLTRIDVTQAVIRRLNAKQFTIVLPDPPKPGRARGGYEPVR